MGKTRQGPNNSAQRQEPTNRPVHEVRLGRIRAAVWANSTETGSGR